MIKVSPQNGLGLGIQRQCQNNMNPKSFKNVDGLGLDLNQLHKELNNLGFDRIRHAVSDVGEDS
jgi:hypothetical protein